MSLNGWHFCHLKMNMKTLEENEYFETTDMSLAVTIHYFGGIIETIDKTNPSRAIFIIKRDKGLNNVIQGFWSHSLQVEPAAFLNSLKETKSRLYQQVE